MKDYELPQALIHWRGDVESLIREMKQRAGAETDSELAAAIGRTQGAVSHWRRKGAVPESVLLGFEDALTRRLEQTSSRAIAARAIAMRLAEFMFQQNQERGAGAGRWLPYMTVSLGFHSITDAIFRSLADIEDGTSPAEVAELVLEDRSYLEGLADWARSLTLSDALSREMLSPPSVLAVPPAVPQTVPQSSKRKGGNG